MTEEWLTYKQLADRLGISLEGARRRAERGRWARQSGNDGRTRLFVPEDVILERRPNVAPDVAPDITPNVVPDIAPDAATIAALQAHVETLKAPLADAEEKASEDANALREHNAILRADVQTLKAQLAHAEGRADETIRASAAQFAHERARADQAIAAFEQLAERLEAIAEARRPWWRRLVG